MVQVRGFFFKLLVYLRLLTKVNAALPANSALLTHQTLYFSAEAQFKSGRAMQ